MASCSILLACLVSFIYLISILYQGRIHPGGCPQISFYLPPPHPSQSTALPKSGTGTLNVTTF